MNEGPPPDARSERITVTDFGQTIELGCSACGAIELIRTEQTPALLGAVKAFAEQHAGCAFD